MAGVGLIFAILGLASGLIGFAVPILSIIGLPLALLGLIFSCVAKKKAKSGLATAGLVIGIIATVFTAITFFTCGICVLCVAGTAGTVL